MRVSFYKQICFVSVKLQTTIRVFYYNNCNNNSFLVSSLMFSILSFLFFAFVGFLLLLFVCLRLKYFGLRVCLSVCVCVCMSCRSTDHCLYIVLLMHVLYGTGCICVSVCVCVSSGSGCRNVYGLCLNRN